MYELYELGAVYVLGELYELDDDDELLREGVLELRDDDGLLEELELDEDEGEDDVPAATARASSASSSASSRASSAASAAEISGAFEDFRLVSPPEGASWPQPTTTRATIANIVAETRIRAPFLNFER